MIEFSQPGAKNVTHAWTLMQLHEKCDQMFNNVDIK